MLILENSQAKISMKEIEEFEKIVGQKLPDDYTAFLLENNGGKPTPRRYKTKDNKIESSIMLFLPLADIESSNLMKNYIIFNKGNLIPKNLLPIGETPRKYQICISLSGKDIGAVYHWFFEDEEDTMPSYDNMYLIANSFSEFINTLFTPQS
ncbi:MAG: SMI1/KNR4 family protein [Ignavibacteriales bacterium]|nr:SMI1/KNR4 family protein [Ignavibacteriales bacterium]